MNGNIESVIFTCIFLTIMAAIIGLTVYKDYKKNKKQLTLDEFIEIYYDQIIQILKDAIVLIQINKYDFEDEESYEHAIILTTIDMLKENCFELGIDYKLINLFDSDALATAIYKVFNSNNAEIVAASSMQELDAE